jgi:hypothetical protein
MIRGRGPVFDVGRNGIRSYKTPIPGQGVRPKITQLHLALDRRVSWAGPVDGMRPIVAGRREHVDVSN